MMNLFDLTGKNAIIIGGAGGLGMLLREALSARGVCNKTELIAIENPFAPSQKGYTLQSAMGIDADAICRKAHKLVQK